MEICLQNDKQSAKLCREYHIIVNGQVITITRRTVSKLSTNLVFFRFPKPNILPRLVYSVRCKRIFSCMGWSSRYRTRDCSPPPSYIGSLPDLYACLYIYSVYGYDKYIQIEKENNYKAGKLLK